MKYEVVELKEMLIGGLAVRTTNEGMQSVADIGAAWQRFMAENIHEKLETRKNNQFIGLYTEYDGDHSMPYTFMAGCELASRPQHEESLSFKTIAGGRYAKFSFQGDVKEAVMTAWGEIWSMDLKRTFESDFEVYHDDGDMHHTSIDIYISIKD